MKITPGDWEFKDVAGVGFEIWASVNIGTDATGKNLQPIYEGRCAPTLHIKEDGSVIALIAYESWRQFPSVNFKEMQMANGIAIAALPDCLEALKDLLAAQYDMQHPSDWLPGEKSRKLERAKDNAKAALQKAGCV